MRESLEQGKARGRGSRERPACGSLHPFDKWDACRYENPQQKLPTEMAHTRHGKGRPAHGRA